MAMLVYQRVQLLRLMPFVLLPCGPQRKSWHSESQPKRTTSFPPQNGQPFSPFSKKYLKWYGWWLKIRRSPVEAGSFSHHLQGFIHPRWLAGFLPSTSTRVSKFNKTTWSFTTKKTPPCQVLDWFPTKKNSKIKSSWWFQPIWKIWVNMGI